MPSSTAWVARASSSDALTKLTSACICSISWGRGDPKHSIDEERFIMIGLSDKRRVLVISHAHRGETVRIISARLAKKRERRFYEHGN